MDKRLEIDVVTLFPIMMEGFIEHSMLGRAIERGILQIRLHDLREWAEAPHYIVDDRPFGGGPGMVMKPEPLFKAIKALKREESRVIYLCPDGDELGHPVAEALAKESHLILISGHYEGVDERVREALIDQEVSIGSYVLTNGTLPAAVLIDAVSRYVPGVLGEEKSLTRESFRDNLLSFPQYTRPAEYEGMKVPEVLLSGDHKKIEAWRNKQQIEKTKQRRPELISESTDDASNN